MSRHVQAYPTPGGRSSLYGAAVAAVMAGACWALLSIGLTSGLKTDRPLAAVELFGGDGSTQVRILRAQDVRARKEALEAMNPADAGQPEVNKAASTDKSQLGTNGSTPVAVQDTPPETASFIAKPEPEAAPVTRAAAVAALEADPLDMEAFRQLARAAQQAEDFKLANRYLVESFHRSFRENDVNAQLLDDSLAHSDFAGVVLYTDALLRTRADLLPVVMPALNAMANQQEGRRALIDVLKLNPVWRKVFLIQYGQTVANFEAFDEIAKGLKEADAPLSEEELGPYALNLIRNFKWDDALTLWMNYLLELGKPVFPLLYNADFSEPINNLPFNWNISDPRGAIIRVVDAPAGGQGRAIEIEFFSTMSNFASVSQVLTLTPGKYRISGKVRMDEFRNARGMVWRVYCGAVASPEALIGETTRLQDQGNDSWRPFDSVFEVPNDRCTIQGLRLELAARIAPETLASGLVWFSQLSIVPEKGG